MSRFFLPIVVVIGSYAMGLATGMLLGWTGTVPKPAFIKKTAEQKRRELKDRIDDTNWYTREGLKMLKDGKK